MITGTRHRYMAEINVVPLVDVVLVLLIIFMVTAPMLYRGMDINLPQTATNTIKPEQRVVLTVERDRQVYVDKDRVPLVQLQPKLQALRQQSQRLGLPPGRPGGALWNGGAGHGFD